MEKIWNEDHQVSWDLVTKDNQISLTGLMQYFLQAAVRHAEHLGFGYTDTSKENLTWVLYRIRIQIDRLPAWKENIKIITWPSRMENLTAYREFKLMDENNNVICKASSEWLVINMKTRRPQRIHTISASDDILTPEVSIPKAFPKLPANLSFKELFSVKVHYSNLDMNGHVNAGYYFNWLSDAVFMTFNDFKIKDIYFNYFHEGYLNDEISIEESTQREGYFRGIKKGEKRPAFVARVQR